MLNFDLSYLSGGYTSAVSPVSPVSSEDDNPSDVSTQSAPHSGGEEVQSPTLNTAHKTYGSSKALLQQQMPCLDDSGTDSECIIPPELAKPPLSYVALISKAILSFTERRALLADIYKYITTTFPYYRAVHDKAWKNSIRHNLSLNECFVKNGRAPDGRGNYWSIHPACLEDFKQGDYRRRQARRRAKGSCQQQARESSVYSGYVPSVQGYMPMTATPTAACMGQRYGGARYQPYSTMSMYKTDVASSSNGSYPAFNPAYYPYLNLDPSSSVVTKSSGDATTKSKECTPPPNVTVTPYMSAATPLNMCTPLSVSTTPLDMSTAPLTATTTPGSQSMMPSTMPHVMPHMSGLTATQITISQYNHHRNATVGYPYV